MNEDRSKSIYQSCNFDGDEPRVVGHGLPLCKLSSLLTNRQKAITNKAIKEKANHLRDESIDVQNVTAEAMFFRFFNFLYEIAVVNVL